MGGVRSWGSNVRSWRRSGEVLSKIERLISYYEMKEVTTIIELADWKAKLGQAEGNVTNRKDYCIEVSGPVKDTILEYLIE